MGSLEELRRWSAEDHHFDPDDISWVLRMAATSIVTGAWRNDSPIEDIHVGRDFKPGHPGERGIGDAEMMAASMHMTSRIAEALSNLERHPQDVFQDVVGVLTDFRSPLTGRPGERCFKEMLTKGGLSRTAKKVRANLRRFELVQAEVGWDRLLLGTALCAANSDVFWGNPAWPTHVRTWADRCEAEGRGRPSVLEAALIEDPFSIPVDGAGERGEVTLTEAVRLAVGYADGRRQWHAEHCGSTEHWPKGASSLVTAYPSTMTGLPNIWVVGAYKRP